MAASLSPFAIQQRTGVALEPSYLVVASSLLPICVSAVADTGGGGGGGGGGVGGVRTPLRSDDE